MESVASCDVPSEILVESRGTIKRKGDKGVGDREVYEGRLWQSAEQREMLKMACRCYMFRGYDSTLQEHAFFQGKRRSSFTVTAKFA